MTGKVDRWLTVVLAPDQQPRFRAMCYVCGAPGEHAPMRVKILAERGVRPGARLGTRRVLVPRCSLCRWNRRAACAACAVLFTAFGGWAIDHPKGYPQPSRPWDMQRLTLAAIALPAIVLAMLGMPWLMCLYVDLFDRADGLHYSFRCRLAAETFAQDNGPQLAGTSIELPPWVLAAS